VRLSALGDTALTLPLLFALRESHPRAFIGWVVGQGAAPLLQGVAELDRLHVWRDCERHPAGLIRLAQEIRQIGYDVALDPQGLTVSALLPFLARIPERMGFASGPLESRELAPLFTNRPIQVPKTITHITRRTLWLSTALGTAPPEHPGTRLPVSPTAEARMQDWWQGQGLTERTLILGLGAGWPTRVWPAEQIAVLAQAAGQTGYRVVMLWGPAERQRLGAWRAVFGAGVVWAPESNIPEMLALLRQCRAYAGPDSAPLHLAGLLGKPTFSWFGASDPARCAPLGDGHRQVACGPHDWRRWRLRPHPLANLKAREVVPGFLDWLQGPPAEIRQ
jgi:heptosyltransferase I